MVLALTSSHGPGPQTRPFLLGVLVLLAGLATASGLVALRWQHEEVPGPRVTLVVAAVLGAAATVLTAVGLVVDVAGGLVDPDVVLLLVGLLAAATGVALLGLRAPARGGTWSRPGSVAPVDAAAVVVAVLVGAGAVLLVAQAVAAGVAAIPVRSTTAEAAAPTQGPTTPPTGVAWERDVDGDAESPGTAFSATSVDVVAAGGGVAYRTEAGVVALDGRTGRERWRFELDGAESLQLEASPGGGTVAVLLQSGSREDGEDGGTRLVALDGATGEPVGAVHGLEWSSWGGIPLVMADTHLLEDEGDWFETEGLSARAVDGTDDWAWSVPQGCRHWGTAATAPAVVVLLMCEAGPREVEVRVLGLRSGSGEELWRTARTVPSTKDWQSPEALVRIGGPYERGARLRASADGSAVRVATSEDGEQRLLHLVLAAEDGRVVADDAAFEDLDVKGFSAAALWGRLLDGTVEDEYFGDPAEDLTYVRRSRAGADQVVTGLCAPPEAEWRGALLATCRRGEGDTPVGVQVVPWEGGVVRVIEGPVERDVPYGYDRLLSALPGVVVVTPEGDRQVVTGLG
ncbi:hypothetical protein [Pseudokineococcus marinus]|uniref:hypothetical protein n=1 Tax=Pseudokineococcus marinus TaxID=351215 RepID=UPI0014895AD7|nr:hypothetical protein [Pseudokineococcus marinus]